MAQFVLNDLPRFSPWPARLLGVEPCKHRRKTPSEITREYEHDKWGPLLARVCSEDRQVTVEEVDEWQLKELPPSLCSIDGKLQLMDAAVSRRRYIEMVAGTLEQYAPAPALLELGAGYGSVLLRLAQRHTFSRMKIMGGELTCSGVKLMQRLASAQALEISAAQCNLAMARIATFSVPPDAIIFTSYATHYIPALPKYFVQALLAFRPRVVIHFEPCFEHCERDTLMGLMRRRYIEVNDYNTNLVNLLQAEEQQGHIRIHKEERAVFGINPLLAASIIVWSPSHRVE
jgi:hypothetical protein